MIDYEKQIKSFIQFIDREFSADITVVYNKVKIDNQWFYIYVDFEILGKQDDRCFLIEKYNSERVNFNDLYDRIIDYIKCYLIRLHQ